jgi:hypothetical protein
MGGSETSVRNYHYSLRNYSEEYNSQTSLYMTVDVFRQVCSYRVTIPSSNEPHCVSNPVTLDFPPLLQWPEVCVNE